MKMKNLMLLLALVGMGTACSNDDDPGNGQTSTAGTGNEIQLVFSGSGESVDYTRAAIASEAENAINTLDVYVFAAATENGTYYYVEKWTKATDDKDNKKFALQPAGTSWKATIYPNELVGLPFVKLYCVANPEDALYQKDGTTALSLVPVTAYDKDTQVPTPAAPTTSVNFETAFTKSLDGLTVEQGNPVKPDLVMTGSGLTKFSGTVSKATIDLKRVVARFDIDNTTQKSQLTIESLSLQHARKNSALFGELDPVTDKVEPADFATALMAYNEKDFSTVTNHNQGLAESALYVYPSLTTDSARLFIKGKYKNPQTGEQTEVTYLVPVVKTPAGAGATPEYIPIKRNNRYKLRILDVTNSNINGIFEIEDWTSGGGVNIKPDNAAPAVDAATDLEAVTGVLPEQDATDKNLYKLTDDAGSFKLTTHASSSVSAKIEMTKADAAWLTITDTKTIADTINPGMMMTTFTFSYTDATGKIPCKVTLRNDAANWDPDVWTVLTFTGPYATPTVSEVVGGATLGNSIDLTDPAAPIATMYKANDSEIKVSVMCIDGVTVNAPNGITVAPEVTRAAADDYTTVYSITITDATQLTGNSATVEFKNAKAEAGKALLTVTINLEETALTLAEGTNTASAADFSDLTNNNIKVDTELLEGNNFTFKINAPQGVTAPDLTTSGWLAIAESHAWADTDGERYAEYTVTLKSTPDYTEATPSFTFANKLTNGGDQTVTFKKLPSKPKFSANTDAVTYPNSAFNTTAISFGDGSAATGNMYKATGSKIYVTAKCAEEMTLVAAPAAGVTVTKQADTDIYEIAISDATSVSGSEIVVTATNNSDSNRSATLTITLDNPAIVIALDDTNANTAAVISGSDVNVTVADLTGANLYAPVIIKLSGYKGSSITYTGETNTWLAAQSSLPSELATDGTALIQFARNGAGNNDATGNIVITVHNAVTGLDEVFNIVRQ